MQTKHPHPQSGPSKGWTFAAILVAALPALAQQAPSAAPSANQADDAVLELSPFEVTAGDDQSYTAATTLAGNRLNTELRDIGNAVTVITSQFLRDTGAINNETLLQYTTGTEVGNIQGNFTGVGDGANPTETNRFANANQNTRVRGLAAADNTRDYFLSDIPWDGYNVDRVDLQRGPNSILFGQGSPAGIINTGLKQAKFQNSGEVEFRYGSEGSIRGSLDVNQVILANELALRIASVYDDEKFQQKPAFEEDKRVYGALRYEPGFLKRGSARTILRGSFETGKIDSNRPRTLPAYDFITPWFSTTPTQGYTKLANGTYQPGRTFDALNRSTYDPYLVQQDNGAPGTSQSRSNLGNGSPNPTYQPWLGNFGQNFGGPLAYFNHDSATPIGYRSPEPRTNGGIGPDGNNDNGIAGIPYNRQIAIAAYPNFARNAGLPYSEFGIYKGISLTDPSVFDFYNNLIDGPNKSEWQEFDSLNLSLAQTFMNDKFGFEANYYNESYENGQLSLLTDTRSGIFVDMNRTFSDGSLNPNVGRPFVTDSGQFGNNQTSTDRESARLTAFFTHDFEKSRSNLLTKILGRHTITGLLAEDEVERDSRNFQRWAVLDQNYINLLRLPASTQFTANELAVNPVIYLGPSLINNSSASGSHIPRPTALQIPRSGTVRVFNSTWNSTVNPADPWTNPFDGAASTQSENPANYVGWSNVPVQITHAMDSQENMDLLTTDARLTRSKLTSKALVWQGYLWNRSIVGTYGYREDTDKAWSFSRNTNSTPGFGHLDLGPTFRLPDDPSNELKVTSRSYSIVAHLNDLPFLSNVTRNFPVNVSVFYNKSENFQPAANRVDIYGEAIASPAGSTHDRGFLIETKDGRYSLRVNKYKTQVLNATSSAIEGWWFIGSSQAWGGNWANAFQYNWGGDTIDTAGVGDPGRYNYGVGGTAPDGTPTNTPEQAAARENAAVAAWRAWQQKVDPRFYAAWGIDLNNPNRAITATQPTGLAVTEDATSEGWEFEFNANPLKNWRVTFNATKSEAIRENIGGSAMSEFVAAYTDALRNTPAGDLRIWWGSAGAETTLFQWNSNFLSNYAQRKLQEGTSVPELREWRFNLVTNYDFTEGLFRGVNVGLGLRWQDEVIIGYPPQAGASAQEISFDLSNPYYGPSETNVDLWIGYGRKISAKLDWRIQLNVRNVGEGDGLIPITVQPDGSAAYYRIAPSQVWTLSNTFRF